jgi:3-hydroxy-D-aspartate aldolase
VEPSKIESLVSLTNHVRELKTNVDNPIHVRALSEAARKRNAKLGVIVELDLRPPEGAECGIRPGKEALNLAKRVTESPGLEFKGIQAYAGYLNWFEQKHGVERKKLECEKVNDAILNMKSMMEDAGIEVETVTGAGTGSYQFQQKVLSELQCGSYVLMDWLYDISAPQFDIAMSVLATVVNARPDLNSVMTDCGWKTISIDGGQPKVKGRPDLQYTTSGDEHGRVKSFDDPVGLSIGDKIELHTSHVCTTVNLHDRMYGVRHGNVEVVWPVEARGRSQ